MDEQRRKYLEEEAKLLVFYGGKMRKAVDRNIDWQLTFKQFKSIMKATRCAYTGVLLDKDRKDNKGNAATLERIDSSKPYCKGNVVLVTAEVNMWKGDKDLNVFLRVAALAKKQGHA